MKSKNIFIAILFAFICQPLFGQVSGIPEADSLLRLKDKLILHKGKNSLEYKWVHYQWIQWIKGREEEHCLFITNDYVNQKEFVLPKETPDGCIGIFLIEGDMYRYKKDTMIYVSKPITFEGFMNTLVEEAVSNDQ